MEFDSLRNYAYGFCEQLTLSAKVAVVGGVIIAFYVPYKYLITRKRKTPIKDNYKQG